MSSGHHARLHVARRSPPNVNKAPIKPPRPAPSSKTAGTPNITLKLAKGTRHPNDHDEDTVQDDQDDDMASSFLQFWSVTAKPSILILLYDR